MVAGPGSNHDLGIMNPATQQRACYVVATFINIVRGSQPVRSAPVDACNHLFPSKTDTNFPHMYIVVFVGNHSEGGPCVHAVTGRKRIAAQRKTRCVPCGRWGSALCDSFQGAANDQPISKRFRNENSSLTRARRLFFGQSNRTSL